MSIVQNGKNMLDSEDPGGGRSEPPPGSSRLRLKWASWPATLGLVGVRWGGGRRVGGARGLGLGQGRASWTSSRYAEHGETRAVEPPFKLASTVECRWPHAGVHRGRRPACVPGAARHVFQCVVAPGTYHGCARGLGDGDVPPAGGLRTSNDCIRMFLTHARGVHVEVDDLFTTMSGALKRGLRTEIRGARGEARGSKAVGVETRILAFGIRTFDLDTASKVYGDKRLTLNVIVDIRLIWGHLRRGGLLGRRADALDGGR
ncbi:hypothetical protein C8Q74DRAFT_1220813 [Fomes fomentarius]|nr:hypothetical protein C8Q74DRAFT_1220813 [Fomes fomentarius]